MAGSRGQPFELPAWVVGEGSWKQECRGPAGARGPEIPEEAAAFSPGFPVAEHQPGVGWVRTPGGGTCPPAAWEDGAGA